MSQTLGIKDSIQSVDPLMVKFKDAVENVWSKGSSFESKTPPHLYRKVVAEASRLRTLGNEKYLLKNYIEALAFYTSSIATAPTESEELSLAFGNRSGVHLINEKYDLCLLDINRALSGRLPPSSKEALLKRKQKCLEQLRAANETKTKLKKAIKNVEKRALYPTERSWLYAHQISKNETDYKIDYGNFDDPIWSASFTNTLIPGLSPKVECAHNAEYGRHFVAADNINPGEVISIQEAFALVTAQDAKFQYCSYCTIPCDALIPCLTCTVEMYCSEGCRTKAHDLYHCTECKIVPSLLYNPDKVKTWLPLRIFLTGTKQGSDLKKIMRDPNAYGILCGRRECVAVRYPTNDYYAILSLTWNMDRKVPAPNQTGRDSFLKNPETFENTMYLFELLQHMNFFDIDKTSEGIRRITDVELFAGLLLLHHVVVAKRYDFNLCVDFTTDPLDFIHTDKKIIACGTGTLQNFVNHLCDANTLSATNRRNVMIFSTRYIKKGEQIFISSSGHGYKHTQRMLRQMSLELKFNNVCKCRACFEDWPTEEIMVKKKKNKYLTKDKGLIQKIEKTHEWFKEAFFAENPPYKYKNGDLERTLSFNKDIRQYVEEPSATIALCESLIQEFMEKKGNCHVIRKLPSTLGPN